MSVTWRPEMHGVDTSPLRGSLKNLEPVRLETVDHTSWEPLWDELVRRYHYLGYKKMLGTRLKYLAFSGNRPIAALGWRAPSLKLEVRDRFIGWSPEQKGQYLCCLANNSRFLIFPWVRVRFLASHLLSRAVQDLQTDWFLKYGHRLWLLETFVDPRRFCGTAYRAANWIHLGPTKGFTKDGPTYRFHGHPKEVFLYVVEPDFRTLIGCRQRAPLLQKPPQRPVSPTKEAQKMLAHQTDWHPDILSENGITQKEMETLADLLLGFHETFAAAFNRPVQRIYGAVLLKGLLSDLDRKSLEPIALRYLETRRVRALQRFVTDSTWDEDLLCSLYRERLANHLASEDEEEGVITVDPSEFPKKGKDSVGVARQYCGALGKVDSCQSGVFIGYTSPKGYGLLDVRLYMPQVWFSDKYAERRIACGVPEDLTFKTKTEIAQDLLESVLTEGLFPARWLACDAAFGDNPAFREKVADQGMYYFAAISSDTSVWLERPLVAAPPYHGRGRRPTPRPLTEPCTVREVARHPDTKWQPHVLAEGAKGPITSEVARCRVITQKDGEPGEELWLFLRKTTNGEIKYFFTNAPNETSLSQMTRILTLRWPLEQSFREGKSELGMDHYEHRSWRGWHRFIAYVLLAMLFLLEVRFHFKKRGPDSPS